MPKPDPLLLDPARYPYHCEIETRYSDVDTNWHINNVALVDILQEGRVRFHSSGRAERQASDVSALAVNLSVDYLGQARHSVPLDMHIAALAVGRTSHTLAQLVTQYGAAIAYAQTVLVLVRDGQPVENSPRFRDAIAQWMMKP